VPGEAVSFGYLEYIYILIIRFIRYALLLLCWRTDPWERPSFRRCYNTLHAISTDLRRSQMASSPADTKPEVKVRFDGQSQEQKDQKEQQPENLSLREVPLKDKQLYANEGVSRL